MRDDNEPTCRETNAVALLRAQPHHFHWRFRDAQREASRPRAEEWFEYGCDCEAAGDISEAVRAYRMTIAIEPIHAEAHFNLGNGLREQGRLNDASQHFLLAVQIESRFTQAWYNLADVLETRGEHRQAIACLQRSVAIDPFYADAHFNLARCYEVLTDFTAASHHWRRYLSLDAHSEWANEARASLHQIERD